MFHLDSHPDARKLLRSRLYLIGLILIFIGPLIASTILYYNPQMRAGLGGASHGDLILPPRTLDSQLLPPKGHKPRWTLMYRANAQSCNLDCEADLFMMRQVRQSLGSKRDRTQLLVLLESEGQIERYSDILQRLGPHHLLVMPETANPELFQNLPKDTLFFVDPLGNLLMHYSSESTSRGMLKDLKRLLSASRIG